MNRTSRSSRLVRIAARSPARSIAGPLVVLSLHAELVGDDLRERGLAESRRARQQHVVERLVALTRSLDENAEVLLDAGLPQVLVEALGAQRAVDLEVVFDERAETSRSASLSPPASPASHTVLIGRTPQPLERMPAEAPARRRRAPS